VRMIHIDKISIFLYLNIECHLNHIEYFLEENIFYSLELFNIIHLHNHGYTNLNDSVDVIIPSSKIWAVQISNSEGMCFPSEYHWFILQFPHQCLT
jgi:hypothetical protein